MVVRNGCKVKEGTKCYPISGSFHLRHVVHSSTKRRRDEVDRVKMKVRSMLAHGADGVDNRQ